MSSNSLQAILQQLNPAQRQAVEAIEGPVMVVAGPGTGKTQVLATRIANIITKTDTPPSAILALTFTESAALNMRQRLVSLIGKTAYYVRIDTFHAFCSQVITTYPEYFPISQNSLPLTDLERFDLMETILLELNLEVLKPLNSPLFYLKTALSAISQLKREGVTSHDFSQLVAEQEIPTTKPDGKPLTKVQQERHQKLLAKNQELALIYHQYQERLRSSARYDFDDMVALVVEAFAEHQELLSEYQENLHYFLVDEYQDTNSAQNKVVDLLVSYWGEQANVFVVGDPNQAIFRFQGASVENVLGFLERYPGCQVVTLDQGYRCSQVVYDAAAQLIAQNHLQFLPEFQTKLRANKTATAKDENAQPLITFLAAPTQTLEHSYVAQEIQRLLSAGESPAQLAVLYRQNSEAIALQNAMTAWQIPYTVAKGDDVLSSEVIRQFLQLLWVIVQVRDQSQIDQLFEVMSFAWTAVEPLLGMKVARAASGSRHTIIDVIEGGHDFFSQHYPLKDVTPLEFASLTAFLDQLKEWSIRDQQQLLPRFIEEVAKESGFLDWLLSQENKLQVLAEWRALHQQIVALAKTKPGFKLSDLLGALETMTAQQIVITAEDLQPAAQAVTLSTVHKAKGREWRHVFVVGLNDGQWGNNTHRELLPLPAGLVPHTDLTQKEHHEDDRRLFYVAMTRASASLTLTYPLQISEAGRTRELIGSVFLEEIKNQQWLKPVAPTHSIFTNPQLHMEKLTTLTTAAHPATSAERDYFTHLLANYKLSVSALNTYLRDPQEFLQKHLLKVPQSTPEHLAFGAAIHAALEDAFKKLMTEGSFPTLTDTQKFFAKKLRSQLLTDPEIERRLAHGQQLLAQYLSSLTATELKPLFIERFFGSGWSQTFLGDIALTGRVDRIDWLDQSQKTVRVIDYKTGQVKSKKHIQGLVPSQELSERERALPESIRGPLQRQLLFYKLLADLDASHQPQVVQGEFIFLEPTKAGKLTSHVLELSATAVDDLKKLIQEVMAEIRSLAFLTSNS